MDVHIDDGRVCGGLAARRHDQDTDDGKRREHAHHLCSPWVPPRRIGAVSIDAVEGRGA